MDWSHYRDTAVLWNMDMVVHRTRFTDGDVLTPGNVPWSVKKNWVMYDLFYKVPHTLWILILIPKKYRKVYAFHVLCDILSHTGKWSIEPLYPLDLTIHGIWDPVDWA